MIFGKIEAEINVIGCGIGCGSGDSSMELAKLTKVELIGIDIDQECLGKFNKKIKSKNLSVRE